MSTVTVYSKAAPIQTFRNLSEDAAAKLVDNLTDNNCYSVHIETTDAKTRTPRTVYLIRKHVTQIEVSP